jgi:hypothetical protein
MALVIRSPKRIGAGAGEPSRWAANKRYPLRKFPDWRIVYIQKIINSFSNVLKEVYRLPIENIEGEKALEKERIIENIIGMTFLTSQIYISGTIADVKLFSKKHDKIKKSLLLKDFGVPLPGTSVTSVELCDAYANYYKHHEEWVAINERNRDTIQTLTSAGIEIFSDKNQMIEVPFSRIIDLLLVNKNGIDLNGLLLILSDWRNRVFASIIKL